MELGKKTIQISFDIEDDKPHKALRIYDTNGNALGYGEMIVKKADPENTLFERKPGYIIYAASIDLDKMIQKEKEVENRKVKTVTKTEEPDVEDSGDSEEDNWVRGSLQQLKDAKVIITLITVQELREQYQKMKHNQKKSSDDTLAVPLKLGNSARGVADGIKPKVIIGDDFEQTNQEVRANATCYGDMPSEYIGNGAAEADWEEQKAVERQKMIEQKQQEIQYQIKKIRKAKEELQNNPISLDDL